METGIEKRASRDKDGRMTSHTYTTVVTWSGNRGQGTSGYRDYGRENDVTATGPAPMAGIVVTGYTDRARGVMATSGIGGRFTEVVLSPAVTVTAPEMVAEATRLHDDAHHACFIANSVNFPVRHFPVVAVEL